MKEQVVVGQLGRKEQEVVEEVVEVVVEEKEQAADSLSLASSSILTWVVQCFGIKLMNIKFERT